MVNYNCLRCGYSTNIKTIMLRHYNRQKVCKAVLEDIDIKTLKYNLINNIEDTVSVDPGESKSHVSQMSIESQKMSKKSQKMSKESQKMSKEISNKSTIIPQNPSESLSNFTKNQYKCEYCNKEFNNRQNKWYHLKTCKIKKEDDEEKQNLLNIVDMLNEQLKDHKKQIDEQNKQINELIKKAGMTIGTQNIQQNIKILAYKNTDLSHLTDQDYLQCLNRSNMVIPNLIKKIHFNPKKPENHNIYISNIKNKYIMVYDGDKWNLTNQNDTIDDLIDTNEVVIEQKLEEWLENGKEYPNIMKKFNRYLEKKEKDAVINKVKEEIKLILYNNRRASN